MATNKLIDASIKTAKPEKKPYTLHDGEGMFLQIMPNGSKRWRLNYSFKGNRKTISLGLYSTVGLKEARAKRFEARQQLDKGIDPSSFRKTVKKQNKYDNEQAKRVKEGLTALGSFEQIAREWGKRKFKDKWDEKNQRAKRLLERNIFPILGHRPIGDIKPAELKKAIYVMRDAGILESANRTLNICARIYRYAVLNDRCSTDITLVLKDILEEDLKELDVKHFASITDPKEVGKLLRAIDSYEGTITVKSALQLAPFVFVRPSELRGMEWEHIDFDKKEWSYFITKTKTDLIVSLSTQALAIIMSLKELTGHGRYVFPSLRSPDRCISENTLNSALRRLDYSKDQMTAHGFRAMARTMLDQEKELKFRPDIIEHQLGHVVKDPNGGAYNRTTFLPERKAMLQQWADYLDDLKDKSNSANSQ